MILATLLFLGISEGGVQQEATAQIVHTLDRDLREPESLRDLRVCEVTENEEGWITTISYRARNGFGGFHWQAAFAKDYGDGVEIDSRLSRMPEFRDIYERQVEKVRGCPLISPEEIEAIRAAASA